MIIAAVNRNKYFPARDGIYALLLLLFINQHYLPYIFPLHSQMLHKQYMGKPCGSFLCQHHRRNQVFVKIGKIPVAFPPQDLEYHKPLDLLPVVFVQLRELGLIVIHISIKIRIMQTVKIAVKGKIHKHNPGKLPLLPQIPAQIQGHHIMFIKPCNPELSLYSLFIPGKGFLSGNIPLDQQRTDCLKHFFRRGCLIAGL